MVDVDEVGSLTFKLGTDVGQFFVDSLDFCLFTFTWKQKQVFLRVTLWCCDDSGFCLSVALTFDALDIFLLACDNKQGSWPVRTAEAAVAHRIQSQL